MDSWMILGALVLVFGYLLARWLDRYTKRKLEANPEAVAEADRAWERLVIEIRSTFRRNRNDSE